MTSTHPETALVTATVIGTFSRRMRLRFDDETVADGRIRDKRQKVVCGDRVNARPLDGETDWLIESVEPRRNALQRPNRQGKAETLAANVDQLVVVAAPHPLPDWFVVDRYLAAAEAMPADGVVVYNKSDLDSSADELDDYARVGYPTLLCSATSGAGLRELAERCANQTSIIVGQSGVGKSSLINALRGNVSQSTASISTKTGEGRHTTVNSVMLPLDNGGQLIDSPGVRDFAPALPAGSDVALGFREVSEAAQRCRFANCQHLREPGCAVKAAVEEDLISARRYESYRRLLALTRRLEEQQRP